MSNEKDENIEEKKIKKDIEIVTGNGKNLKISPVFDHVKVDKPTSNIKKGEKVIIPKAKKNNQ